MRLVLFRGWFYAYERVAGQPKRISLRTRDRNQALQRLADLEASRRRKATMISEMHAIYLAERGPQIASQETLRFAWKRLEPIFGPLRPDQVDRALTRAYAAQERQRGVGNGSIRRDLSVLSAIVRHNDKQSPAIIELPPATPPRSQCLTREQIRALRDAASQTPHLYLFVTLAYRTGGRKAAILDLTWDRVELARGQIRLGRGERLTKGRATVPMTDDTAMILREAHQRALTDYVIEYGGQRVFSIQRAFKAAVRRAGLPAATSPHWLRHSAAVHMAEAGTLMSEISQFLGHSSEAVTFRVYARYSPDYLRRAAASLE
jgi:integrase